MLYYRNGKINNDMVQILSKYNPILIFFKNVQYKNNVFLICHNILDYIPFISISANRYVSMYMDV